MAKKAPYQIPFDRFYEEQKRRIAEEQAGLQSQRGLEENRFRRDVQSQREDLGRGYEQSVQDLQGKLASSGILRSGINIKGQGERGAEYTRGLGQLGQAEARGLSDLARSFLDRQSGLQSRLEGIDFERARAAQEYGLEHAKSAASARTSRRRTKRLNRENKRLGKDIRQRAAKRRVKG